MAKQGMKRPSVTKLHPKNDQGPVPILQGKAKTGKEKAKPIVAGTHGPDMKVWHEFGNDMAAENLWNDVPPEDR